MRSCSPGVCCAIAGSLLVIAGPARGAAKNYDFKDPKGVNAMSFVLDSVLEPIMGLASGISGVVSFDPDKPEATSGSIVVSAKSLHIENQGMEKTLHGGDWLDVDHYPEITFTFRKIKNVKRTPSGAVDMIVIGDFTVKGVTKRLTIPVRATHLAGRLGERLHRGSGDLLVLRTRFTINRKKFNISPGSSGEVVADEIEIRASIVGMAPERQ